MHGQQNIKAFLIIQNNVRETGNSKFHTSFSQLYRIVHYRLHKSPTLLYTPPHESSPLLPTVFPKIHFHVIYASIFHMVFWFTDQKLCKHFWSLRNAMPPALFIKYTGKTVKCLSSINHHATKM